VAAIVAIQEDRFRRIRGPSAVLYELLKFGEQPPSTENALLLIKLFNAIADQFLRGRPWADMTDMWMYSDAEYVLGQPRFYTKTHLFHLYIKA
jgi:hypothetical protein